MLRRLALMILAALPLMAVGQSHPRKYKAPPPAGRLEILVIRDTTGKPVVNAAVILHPIEGDKDRGAMELKSNDDGIALLDQVVPLNSTVRLQVIAPGFQTYGEDYKIDSADKHILVRLKRPASQYSIYPNPPAKSAADKAAEQKSEQKKGESKPTPADPTAPTAQPETQSKQQPK